MCKKLISAILFFSIIISVCPAYINNVYAASVNDYIETSKDNVSLRKNYGSENSVVCYVTNKGSAMQILAKEKKWVSPLKYNIWYKVSVNDMTITTDRNIGIYWVYEGNVTKHTHNKPGGVCKSMGCTYSDPFSIVDNNTVKLTVTADCPLRPLPYYDSGVSTYVKKGDVVTAVKKVKNSQKSHIWYELDNGYYVYSSNVKIATQKKVDKNANNSYVQNSKNEGKNPTTLPVVCTSHKYSDGYCVNCGAEYPHEVYIVLGGTYKTTSDNTCIYQRPYKNSTVVKKIEKSGTVVDIDEYTKNSYGNIWYKTKDGWIYNVGDVSLKSAKLNISEYTFNRKSESVTPKIILNPSNAVISSTSWEVDDSNIVSVDSNGKITPKAAGKTRVTCTVKSKEGITKMVSLNVIVPKEIFYDDWSYTNNYQFNYDLALECSTYSALAYPGYTYTVENGQTVVYPVSEKPSSPTNLTKMLKDKNFEYQVINYNNKTAFNSPFVIASKYFKESGKVVPVIYVIIQGTGGYNGWRGNMMMTGESYSEMTEHATFESSAQNIKSELDKYIKNNKMQGAYVVVTGHSRGAAAGNLLAQKLQNNLSSNTYKKVYAYLFATPNTTKNPTASKNIYNICNTIDFVSYIPLSTSGWGYEKNGKIYCFNAKDVYSWDSGFKKYIDVEYKYSTKYSRTKPDYKWCSDTPDEMRDYISGTWRTTREYYKYNKSNSTKTYDEEAYDYFLNGVAAAASGKGSGIEEIIRHTVHNCVYNRVSWFMAGNGFNANPLGTTQAFQDSHEMMTYHAAMLAKVYNSSNQAYLFDEETAYDASYVVLEEKELLTDFFNQDENQLMLELYGWNIEDSSTWAGIKCDENGHVVSIDIGYMNLTGWLDVSDFSQLETLICDGNSISLIALSGCESLTNLSCSSNNIKILSVNACSDLQNLNCSFNELTSLDVSNMSNLSNLNCYGNDLNSLNLNGATGLNELRCGNNELTGIDISTNTALNTFYCENNNIIEYNNSELMTCISNINENGGSAEFGLQKYDSNYSFDSDELTSMKDFANSSLNLEKLGWDLAEPYTWQGVEWKICGDEYHITAINFDDLDLEGSFELPDADYLKSISCSNSSLSSLNLSGCTALENVNCYSSGISDLRIDECNAIDSINCDKNYLAVDDISTSLSQIGLNTGLATYENQNIEALETDFNEIERETLINLLNTGENAEILSWDITKPGTWEGVVWTNADGIYRVNKLNFADESIVGELDLSKFDYLEDFNFSGTQLDTVVLPECITKIPENAFYNSEIKNIFIAEGVTNIEKTAFAYCDKLTTVVLPKSISRIYDRAFYESNSLKNVVFIGNEPFEVGNDIFSGASNEFKILYFADTQWNADSSVFEEYFTEAITGDNIILLNDLPELKNDTYYSMENNYSGDDIPVTLVTRNLGDTSSCILAVYTENNTLDSSHFAEFTATRYMNNILFEDVDVQYVGETHCVLKAFWWENTSSLKPLAKVNEVVMEKPESDNID